MHIGSVVSPKVFPQALRRRRLTLRKALWISLAILVLAIVAPSAHADTVYKITFTGTGAPTVVGSDLIDFDTALMKFTTPTISINYQGFLITLNNFNLTGVSPTADTFIWNFDSIFLISRTTNNLGVYAGTASGQAPLGNGSVTFTAQTPEPATGVLMLFGIAAMLLMRKRLVPRLHKTT
jgi:hypothetical protein